MNPPPPPYFTMLLERACEEQITALMVTATGKVFLVYSFEMCKIKFSLNRHAFYSYIAIKPGDGDTCIRDVRLGFFSPVERFNPWALLRAELCNLRLKTPKKSVSRGPR